MNQNFHNETLKCMTQDVMHVAKIDYLKVDVFENARISHRGSWSELQP